MRNILFAGALAIAALSGCASDRDNRILAGAALGGVAGSVLSGGNGAATAVGAVAGGAIGAQSHDNQRRDRRTPYERCRDNGYSDWQCRRN